ncbi:MAG: hypothetical protein H7A48_06645 [Akkermansiaceae bacterium]|nr:hypothetical protein [Akkermansiaceae bacterium]MCP5547433.1 hypothetical protein [Akkermansiaceae bacterium]
MILAFVSGIVALEIIPAKDTTPLAPEAFGLVRPSCSCKLKTDEFLVERTSILKSAGESSVAFDRLVWILGSDGLSSDESRFLTQAKSPLFD